MSIRDARIPCKDGRCDPHFTALPSDTGTAQRICLGGRPVTVDDFDVEAAAKAIYRDYEDCPMDYVERVWAGAADGDETFMVTVDEFTQAAISALTAALGQDPT